jgi:Domain of unknown function (DUF2017)
VAQRIRRSEAGLVLTLDPTEVEILRDLAGQLESLFDGGVPVRGGDPTRDRLFPRAYLDPTEDVAETEWQVAIHEDLVRQKSEAVGALVDSLETATAGRRGVLELTLPPEVVDQWLGALNDVRLALGVVLDVSEDEMEIERNDPRAPGLELYGWLTWLQGSLVQALLEDVKDPPGGDE